MRLHIMKASGRLKDFEPLLTTGFNEVAEKVEEKITVPPVDVVVVHNSETVIPETGMGGFAINANLIYVNIDPDSEHFKSHVKEELVSTVAHELHHCARIDTIGYGKTLLEAMVSEGLADHFDMEINNHEPRPWSVYVKGAEFDEVYAKTILEFDNDSYDHIAWFFGSKERGIPRWTGYTVGFEIVKKYMEKTGKTAAELVSTPANLFIEKD